MPVCPLFISSRSGTSSSIGGLAAGAAFQLLALGEKRLRSSKSKRASVASVPAKDAPVVAAPFVEVKATVVEAAPASEPAGAPATAVKLVDSTPLERPLLNDENLVLATSKVRIEVSDEDGKTIVRVISTGLSASQLDKPNGLFKRIQAIDGVTFVGYKNFQQGVKMLTLSASAQREALVAALKTIVASDARFA